MLEEQGCKWLHLDIMDGRFVPNITFGPPVIAKIRPHSKMFFDTHLMIEEPERYISDFKKAGADLLSVQVETCVHLDRVLTQIREEGMMAGVVLNPSTPLSSIEWVLDKVNLVLIMSVNPGFGGQAFIHSMVRKIMDLKKMIIRKAMSPNEVSGSTRLACLRLAVCRANLQLHLAGLTSAGLAVFMTSSLGEALRPSTRCKRALMPIW